MAKFRIFKDGEWVQPIRKGYRMMCCDCGLVHKIDFRVLDYRTGKEISIGRGGYAIQFKAIRDNRATGQARRWGKLNNDKTG